MEKILIVDDENDIAELISDILEDEGYETVIANDGKTAIKLVKEENFDLVLLDVMMPKLDGWSVLRKIRQESNLPVIMLTARGEEQDELVGFEVGADDYITKPFVNEELVARVKAHLRREGRLNTKKANVIKIGEIKLNKESFEVFKNDELIMLSTKEFELLRYLMENAGIVLSKEQIYQSVWKNNYGDIGTVAVNIKSLRNKLDTDEKYIKTIWGMGYKFVKDVQ